MSSESTLEGKALGKYQILKKIGEGNMATVYLAQDPFIDRPVAIKVARSEHVEDGDNAQIYRRLFFNEAQAAGMLKHPNITAIYDAGSDNGHFYIVMEYVHGGRTLEEFTSVSKLLPIERITSICYQCALALDYAHRKGVVHRDIKPRNLLLTDSFDVKITDFGVAVVAHLADDHLPEHAGSPLYMSPEQVKQEPVTGQSDLFSLGIVAYELLTGKHPFEGRNLEAINHLTVTARHRPLADYRAEIPPIFERIIDKVLAKKPKHRYKTGADLAGDLALVNDFLRKQDGRTTQQEKYARVHDLPFFAEFQDLELWEVINAAEWFKLGPDEKIIGEGESEASFFIVVSGEVVVLKNGREIISLKRGDCFGEMGLVSGRHRSATIVSKTDVTVMKVRGSVIDRTSVNCQLRFQRNFLAALIERLEIATERMSQLAEPARS
ncbi:MAG: protein kinase [Gammaproteobacteria bacterium]|nr:protein kinase [Gammaproteobacteria bacterium]